jgi:hypothetical protein
MQQTFKYGLQLGNRAKNGLRVSIVVEKEATDLKPLPMTTEEVEECLREVGRYLHYKADFKTLKKIK